MRMAQLRRPRPGRRGAGRGLRPARGLFRIVEPAAGARHGAGRDTSGGRTGPPRRARASMSPTRPAATWSIDRSRDRATVVGRSSGQAAARFAGFPRRQVTAVALSGSPIAGPAWTSRNCLRPIAPPTASAWSISRPQGRSQVQERAGPRNVRPLARRPGHLRVERGHSARCRCSISRPARSRSGSPSARSPKA